MCGRFNVESDPLSRLLMELVQLRHPGPDNHNTAPTEAVVVLRLNDAGEPELVPMRWWLTPAWAPAPDTRYSMFNAKSETVHSSRAFREPFRRRRCVVPVSGFYEWVRSRSGKLPYYIRPQQQPGMLLAGIWDRWRPRDGGEPLESFAILTTDASPGLAFIHSRQPVMLSADDARCWLDPASDAETLMSLLGPEVPVPLDAVPVSTYVNNARNKESRCVQPIGEPVAVAVETG